MDQSYLPENLPENPDELLRVGLAIVQRSFREKAEVLMLEVEHARKMYNEKASEAATLKDALTAMQFEMKQQEARIKQLSDEKIQLIADKTALLQQTKKLSRDVAKLNHFRKAIIKSVSQEDDDLASIPIEEINDMYAASMAENFSDMRVDDDEVDFSESRRPPTGKVNGLQTPQQPQQTTGASVGTNGSPKESTTQYQQSHLSFNSSLGSSGGRRTLADQDSNKSPRRNFENENTTNQQNVSMTNNNNNNSNNSSGMADFAQSEPVMEGKEFFRQAKNRLSYEQFNQFLACIKKLNSQLQTRDETLRMAKEIFGKEHEHLYQAFRNLLSKHVEI